MLSKKKIEDGPLRAAIWDSRNSIARHHAVMQYRENLAAASIEAAAWRHGGFLFMALCALCFGGALVGIWREFPGEALIPWASTATSFLATYMLGRSSRLLRRAAAGWPWHRR